MKCSGCGATIPDGSQQCAFCGETAPVIAAAAGRPANVFDRIRESPQFQQANSFQRLATIAKPGIVVLAIPLVFLIVFVIAALGMASMAAGQGAPTISVIVPVGMGVAGVLMAVAVVGGGTQIVPSTVGSAGGRREIQANRRIG